MLNRPTSKLLLLDRTLKSALNTFVCYLIEI